MTRKEWGLAVIAAALATGLIFADEPKQKKKQLVPDKVVNTELTVKVGDVVVAAGETKAGPGAKTDGSGFCVGQSVSLPEAVGMQIDGCTHAGRDQHKSTIGDGLTAEIHFRTEATPGGGGKGSADILTTGQILRKCDGEDEVMVDEEKIRLKVSVVGGLTVVDAIEGEPKAKIESQDIGGGLRRTTIKLNKHAVMTGQCNYVTEVTWKSVSKVKFEMKVDAPDLTMNLKKAGTDIHRITVDCDAGP